MPELPECRRGPGNVCVHVVWLRPREGRDEADPEAHGRASLDERCHDLARPDARSGAAGPLPPGLGPCNGPSPGVAPPSDQLTPRRKRLHGIAHLARRRLGYIRRMTEVTIKARANGPYKVEGPVRVIDAEGNEFVLPEGSAIVLCRCGHSRTKPFCDSSHKRVGFVADDSAPRAG